MEHKVFTQPKKRQSFNIMRENAIIEDLTSKLPEGESFVYITSGGFSSIAFIVAKSRVGYEFGDKEK